MRQERGIFGFQEVPSVAQHQVQLAGDAALLADELEKGVLGATTSRRKENIEDIDIFLLTRIHLCRYLFVFK